MKTALIAMLTVAAALVAPAVAGTTEQIVVRVAHADLDLTRPAHAEIMLSRIERAAAKACQVDAGTRDLHSRMAARTCAANATGVTVASLDAPLVTALHDGEAHGTQLAAAW